MLAQEMMKLPGSGGFVCCALVCSKHSRKNCGTRLLCAAVAGRLLRLIDSICTATSVSATYSQRLSICNPRSSKKATASGPVTAAVLRREH